MDTIQAYSRLYIFRIISAIYTIKSLAKRQSTFILKHQLNYTFLGSGVEWESRRRNPKENVNRQCKYRVDLLFPIQFSGNKMKKQ